MAGFLLLKMQHSNKKPKNHINFETTCCSNPIFLPHIER